MNYWKEGCGGGSIGSETVLSVGEGERVYLGEEESLQHLDGRAENGDGTVAARLGRWFS